MFSENTSVSTEEKFGRNQLHKLPLLNYVENHNDSNWALIISFLFLALFMTTIINPAIIKAIILAC
jgi:hypothetical protein